MNTEQAQSHDGGALKTLVAGAEAAREGVAHTVETAKNMVETVAVLRRFSARNGAQRSSAPRNQQPPQQPSASH